MQKKRILYIVTKSVWGGAQKYVYDLATHIPKDHFEPLVAAGGNGALFNALQEKNIQTISIPSLARDIHFLNELGAVRELWHIILATKPDIVHLNSSKVGGLGAIAAKCAAIKLRKPIRVVFTVHGWGFNESRPMWQKAIMIFISGVASLFQDKLIIINSDDLTSARSFVPETKLCLIPNGIAKTPLLTKTEARAKLATHLGITLPPQSILIGSIGEYTKNKGFTYLLSALARIKHMLPKHARAILIGDGEERNVLLAHISNHELESHISLAGFIPDAHTLLPAFDIFILPSLKEGLPYSIMEAMSAGLPIIASNVGGIPDLLNHKTDGLLVAPKNATEIASAIQELTENRTMRLAFGKSAQAKIISQFTLDSMIKKTCALYDEL